MKKGESLPFLLKKIANRTAETPSPFLKAKKMVKK